MATIDFFDDPDWRRCAKMCKGLRINGVGDCKAWSFRKRELDAGTVGICWMMKAVGKLKVDDDRYETFSGEVTCQNAF